jgi:hypothetical protein
MTMKVLPHVIRQTSIGNLIRGASCAIFRGPTTRTLQSARGSKWLTCSPEFLRNSSWRKKVSELISDWFLVDLQLKKFISTSIYIGVIYLNMSTECKTAGF